MMAGRAGTARRRPDRGGGRVEDSDLPARILAEAEGLRTKNLNRLREIGSLDAPSGNGELLGRVADILSEWLTGLGSGVIRHSGPVGPQLEAVFGPAGPEGEALILCHYDTVWPVGTVAGRPVEVSDESVRGPGVLDMRGGMVAALGAIEVLARLKVLNRPVRVLMTPDEETGSRTSKELIRLRARRAVLVLVPEPALPGGSLKTSRKGWINYEITVQGREAHAGLDPDAGVSAIDELVDLLVDLRALATPEAGTTINCGTITGGTAANVIAGSASASIDVRVANRSEEERVKAAIAGTSATRVGAKVMVKQLHSRPPLERTPEIAAAAVRTRKLGRKLGLEVGEGSAGGVSDANLLAGEGVTVLDGIGPDGGGAHAVDEWTSIQSIVDRTALVSMLLIERWSGIHASAKVDR